MPQKITLLSSRQSSYRKMIPVFVGIICFYMMAVLVLVIGLFTFAHNYYFAFFGLIGLVFICLLGFLTYNLIRDISCDYILEINNVDAIFSKIDNWQRKRTDQLILLTDIKFVEYYPYQDSASVIFHTSYIDIDVPLWTMGDHGQDVLDFLEGAGIKVINVQSDEPIPP